MYAIELKRLLFWSVLLIVLLVPTTGMRLTPSARVEATIAPRLFPAPASGVDPAASASAASLGHVDPGRSAVLSTAIGRADAVDGGGRPQPEGKQAAPAPLLKDLVRPPPPLSEPERKPPRAVAALSPRNRAGHRCSTSAVTTSWRGETAFRPPRYGRRCSMSSRASS